MDTTTVRYYRAPGVSPIGALSTHIENNYSWLVFSDTSRADLISVNLDMVVGEDGTLYFACTSDGALLQPYSAPEPTIKVAKSVWETQVGGSHYKDMPIQPFQFSMANKLDPMQHTAIKYVSRFRVKGGIEDLRKAIQTIELLIQWEQDNDSTSRSTPVRNGGNGNGQSGACAYPAQGTTGY